MRAILRGRVGKRQPEPGATTRGRLRRLVQRAAFAALYGPGARLYDRFTGWLFLGEWERWQASVLPFLPDRGRILELGCGTGALAARAVSGRRRWCCLETSKAMIAAARPRCSRTGAMLIRGDARALPFADGSFAAAVATFPTAYILAEETQLEVARVVADGGSLAIVLSGRLSPTGVRRAWRCRVLRLFYGGGGGQDDEIGLRPPFPGFAGAWSRVPTTHGEALVYVGARVVTELRQEGESTPSRPTGPRDSRRASAAVGRAQGDRRR